MVRACPVCSSTDDVDQAALVPDPHTEEEERELLAALRRSHDEAAHALEMLQEVRRQRDVAVATIEAERSTAAARERSLFDLLSSADIAQAELRRLVAQAAATPRLAEAMAPTIVEAATPDPTVAVEPVAVPVPVAEEVHRPVDRASIQFAMPRPVPRPRVVPVAQPQPEERAPQREPEVTRSVANTESEEQAELDGKRSWWPRSRPHSPLDELYLD
jgi:hypothetical protein